MGSTASLKAIGYRSCEGFGYRTLFLGLALFAALFVLSSKANADTISIGLQEAGVNGGAITTVVTSTPGAGFASYAGSYGDFSFNSISGEGSPNIPEPGFSSSSFDAQSVSTGGHVLNVFITQQGLSSPTGVQQFLSSFTSQTFSGAIASVVEQTFIDSGNGLFGGTLLASSTFTAIGNNSSLNASPYLSSPYSETVEYTITTNGQGSVNDTIDLSLPVTSTPEPSTLLLCGLGIAGLLLVHARQRLTATT